MSDSEPHWFDRVWSLIYDGWNFAQFLAGAFAGTWMSQITGITWSTPLGPWLAVIAAVLGGIAIVRVARFLWTWIYVVLKKPFTVIDVESSGTDKPVLEIQHFGAPVTYFAEGRIIKTLDPEAATKPSRNRFACELQQAEGKEDSQRVTLRDGDWAHIVLADIVKRTDSDRQWLRLRRGTYNKGALAEDSGVAIEITVKGTPSWRLGEMKRTIHITRDGQSIKAVTVDNSAISTETV